MTRPRTLLTGLAAAATLAAIVGGLPALLLWLGGSPIPRGLPDWRQLAARLDSRDDAGLLLAVIRDFAWLAWLVFTACVLIEAFAAIRGNRAPQLRLGAVQGSAARLVALAALTFATPASVALTASVAPVAMAGSSIPGIGLGAVDLLATAAYTRVSNHPSAHARATAFGARFITVRIGDCLWSIAEHYLGAGDRYPEIVYLNLDHHMGNGQVFSDPSFIEPGWQLLIPGGSPRHQLSVADSRTEHGGHATNDPRYRGRHAAAGHQVDRRPLADAAARGSAAHARGRSSIGERGTGAPSATSAPNGQDRPAIGGPDETAATATPTDQLSALAVFAAGVLAGSVLASLNRLRHWQRQARRRGRRIALPESADVLAAEQRLRATASIGLPGTLREALGGLEVGIARLGQTVPDVLAVHVTPASIELLLSAPAADSPPAPWVITPGRQGMCWELDLASHRSDAAHARGATDRANGYLAGERPDGYSPLSSPRPGSRHRAAGLPADADCHLLPGLVTGGVTADGYLLLDLEALQVTGCDGPLDLVEQVITAAATELATCQWGGWYELILVGYDELNVLGRAEHCSTLDEALGILATRRARIRQRLAGEPLADVPQLRIMAPDDADWTLTVLVSRIEPTPTQMEQLLDLVEDGPGGVAALTAGDPETSQGRMTPTVLQLAPDPAAAGEVVANLVPLQITMRPRTLSPAEYAAINSLFAAAADVRDVSPQAEPYATFSAPPWLQAADPVADERAGYLAGPDGNSGGFPDEDQSLAGGTDRGLDDGYCPPYDGYGQLDHGDSSDISQGSPFGADHNARPWADQAAPRHAARAGLRVQILGPVTVTGGASQLQPKQAELVLALALAAPGGSPNSALCSILGSDPDHPKPSDSVRQLISRTRRRLGKSADGRELIIHEGNGHYALHPDTVLDWAEFKLLVGSGRPDDLRTAVSLIRGQPFTGSYHWWIDVPLLETIRAELVDASEQLAELELAAGAPRPAARAARAGLLAEPSAEQLWRALMRAEYAAGSRAGVSEAWRRCLEAIEDVAPGGEPHPDTVALYTQLIGPRQHQPARA